MATLWRRAMLFLGLGPDDEYDDDVYEPVTRPDATRPPPAADTSTPLLGAVRPIPREPEPVHPGTGRTAVVRPLPPVSTAKVVTVAPGTFNDAQEIADKFMAGQPVIVNLQGVERDVSRRLVDFASGLCYGMHGQMKQVANRVYLLTPADVEVSAEDKRRLQERGLYRA